MIEDYSRYSKVFSGKALEPSLDRLVRAGQVAKRDIPSREDSMSKVRDL